MQPGVEPLEDPVPENRLQETVPPVRFYQAVTMAQHEAVTVPVPYYDIPMDNGSYFLWQIIEEPYIVIACKYVDLHTLVTQLGQLPEKPGESPGDHLPVLEPVIENIPQQP